MQKIKLAVALVALVMLAGCATPHVKPGTIETALATQTQPQNPKDRTDLVTDSTKMLTYVLPAGSTVAQHDPVTGTNVVFTISSNMPVRVESRDVVDSSIGGADMSIGKLIAKLQSVRWIQGAGVLVFLFGAASFAYPPLRAIVGSVTTSVVIAASGLALVVLPILVVGNELWILGGCAGVAAAYFFIHRYGKKSGEVEVLKKWVDKNKDGKVDPGEMV